MALRKGRKVTVSDNGHLVKGTIAEVKGDSVYINIPSFMEGVPMQVVRTKENLAKFNKI